MLALLLASLPALAQGFGAFISPGPLAEPHAELDGLTTCTSCHQPGAGVSAERCVECHEHVGDQLATATGFHAGKEACGSCHRDHRGRDAQLTVLDPNDFDHDATGFPLLGAHAEADCEACHDGAAENHWVGSDPSCDSCHLDDEPHGATPGREAALARCDSCHGPEAWSPPVFVVGRFDHEDLAQVDFVVSGAHGPVSCVDCHADAVFTPIGHDRCTDCHESSHRAEAFTAPCEDCHEVVEAWRVPGFDHETTGYLLDGQHADVRCTGCHGVSRTDPVPHDRCEDCHRDIHEGQFQPRACADCHDVFIAQFRLPAFDHTLTDYPLRGPHTDVACQECHGELPAAVFVDTPHADCDDCHDDPHVGQFEPTSCAVCHDEATGGWAVTDFDHARTRFRLEGEHERVACERCHPNEQWQVPFDSCDACHTEHPHGAQLTAPRAEGRRCESCHAPAGWSPPLFDHDRTDFGLHPQHERVACADCHALDDFTAAASSCDSCHDRPSGHYSGSCDTCHVGPAWVPATLGGASHDLTGFPLDGAHQRQDCDSCHPAGRPRSEARPTCISCHSGDDIHRGQLGVACQDCHQPTTWMRSRFRHQWTGWPLRGAHRLAACQDCHVLGYVGTPTTCRVCHESRAPPGIPSHQSSFFPLCDTCHRPFTWDLVRAVH